MYETEEQQVEAIKKWFTENGRQTIITVVAVIVLVFAGRIYLDNQQKHRESASVKYMELLSAVQDELLTRTSQQGGSGDQEEGDEDHSLTRTTAKTLAREFVEMFPKTAQAPFAAMSLGGYAAQDGEFEKALAYYEWAVEAASSEVIVHLASLRAARLEIALGDAERAIRRLQSLESTGEFERLRLSLLGDASLASEDDGQARLYYEAAREVKKKDGTALPSDPWLNMRYYDLVTDTRTLSTGVDQAELTGSADGTAEGNGLDEPAIDDTKG